MNQITDEDLRKIAADVEREYGTCGLSGDTLYEDFAVDVAWRAIAMERERWRDKVEALEHSWDDQAEAYGMRLALAEAMGERTE